jgi:hypothetical protein
MSLEAHAETTFTRPILNPNALTLTRLPNRSKLRPDSLRARWGGWPWMVAARPEPIRNTTPVEHFRVRSSFV